MSALEPSVEADRLIAKTNRPGLGAYWLEAILFAGTVACGLAVCRALTTPRNAVVITGAVRKGEALGPEHIGYAPLTVSSRNVTRAHKIEGLVAASDLEPGMLLGWRDVVKPRRRAGPQELELALRLFVGDTPPRPGDDVLLGVVASDGGKAFVLAARVLTIDASARVASVTVAMDGSAAATLAAVPKPQIQLVQRPRQEPRTKGPRNR